MSILVRYVPDGMTSELYDAASAKAQDTLSWPPDGLELHVCFGEEGSLRVSEIWESREAWRAFGEQLMPVLAESGIHFSSEPEVFAVHTVEQP